MARVWMTSTKVGVRARGISRKHRSFADQSGCLLCAFGLCFRFVILQCVVCIEIRDRDQRYRDQRDQRHRDQRDRGQRDRDQRDRDERQNSEIELRDRAAER